MTPLHGIACFYNVGFGARAVSRKTPIYFIRVLEFSFCPANAPQVRPLPRAGRGGAGQQWYFAGRGSNRFFRRGAGRGTPFAPRGGASIPDIIPSVFFG